MRAPNWIRHTKHNSFFQSCLHYCYISQPLLTYFSQTGNETTHPSTSFSMNYSTGNLMVNTAHKISCLCECIGQGNLRTLPPILLHLLLSTLSAPSLPSLLLFCLTTPFLSSLSPSPPIHPPSSLCLYSVFNSPIHQRV